MRLLVPMAALALATAACGGGWAGPAEPTASATRHEPLGSRPCTVGVAEYCQAYGGPCPGYAEQVERFRSLCTRAAPFHIYARDCGGGYRSLSTRDSLLGGVDEYFDGQGELVGSSRFTDYAAYCNGTSFTQEAGPLPPCENAIRESLCVR